MKKNLLFFILCFSVLCITQAYAQTRTITGTVTDKADGTPLPGVTVRVEGNQIGTQTGSDGKYSLKVPATGTIIFSFIGYTPLNVTLAGKGAVINAAIVASSSQLNEVVVTGVGVATEKSKVAIDVASVSAKDFPKSATTNVTQALTGQIAGVNIIQRTSQPGSSPLILLRGVTNLGQGQGASPLIMIDGVIVNSDMLTNIDPNIVDHVEVVKGAAGGMLYGSQGGNGVIQVFTKKGAKNGKLSVDISTKYSNDRIIELNNIFAQMHHYNTDASGNLLTSTGTIVAPNADGIWNTPAYLPYSAQPTVVKNDKAYNMPTYDHVAQANRVANTFSNAVNIRGGTEKADFAFGINNLQQQDVFSNSYNRTNLNLNVGFNLAKGLTFRNNTQLFYTWNNLLAGSRFNMIMTPLYIDLKFIDPNTGRYVIKPSSLADGNNPLAERDVHNTYSKVPRLVQTFDLDYKFPKFLELDVKYNIDQRITDNYDLYANQTGLPQALFFGSSINGAISTSNSTVRQEYGNGSAFFRTDFKNDFHLNVPIRTTTQVSYDFTKYNQHGYSTSGTALPPFPPYTIGLTGTKTAGESYDQALYFGYLVNQTIDWSNIAGISAGFRSDYSSSFGSASSAFTFPRGTVYVNPSEFFNGHDLVYNWKLRAAYGEAGVQPGHFDRQVTLSSTTLGSVSQLTSLTTPSGLNNPALKVQVTKELEFGTDITLTPSKTSNWFSTVTFSGSYWERVSNDAIQSALAAPSTGGASVLDNLVSLKGHGFDLSADMGAYKSKNFDWNLGLRFATQRVFVTKISNGQPVNAGLFTLAEGQQLGFIYTQTPLHSVDQLKPDGTRYIATTDVGNYVMVDGNVVNKNTYAALLTASNDLTNMGNVSPAFTSSMINRFTIYKKITASFQFDWNYGQKTYNATRQYLARDQISSDFDKQVTINGNTGAYVAYWNSFYNALNPVSTFVENGSFVRLRDVSISYDLTSLVKQKWLKSLVFTATGRNLATFTKYSGLDPEITSAVSSSTGGGLGNVGVYQGVDYYGQPNLKSYQFSFNIGF